MADSPTLTRPPKAEATPAAARAPKTDLAKGLTASEVQALQQQYGPNALAEKHVNPLLKLLTYFWGPIPWMIEAAAILSGLARHWEDLIIIVIMLLINAGVGFFEEFKAGNAIAALKQRLAPTARALRDGKWVDIAARELVPGDVVFLKLGNVVPADAILVQDGFLSVDQSALTGESLPVDREADGVVYSGSIVRQGEMKAIVTATGMNTYFGKTAHLVETAEVRSHFQRAVLHIGNFLIFMTLGLVAIILTVALFRGDPLTQTLLFALILTVAAIPVALPAVLSVTMAVGAATLAKMQAIVSRLVSIEEMAGIDVLCSDKTGTLTKNELSLGDPVLIEGKDAGEVKFIAALACEREAPDAIDKAVLIGVDDKALADYSTKAFRPFDPVKKEAEADIEHAGESFSVAKGAPQAISKLVGATGDLAERVMKETDALAARGYRTLGVAKKGTDGKWHYLGLLALFDPPREDSASTIAEAKDMGLRVIMVTGDHGAIGRETAHQLKMGDRVVSASEVFSGEKSDGDGDSERIANADVIAEVFPEHKFKIVRILQKENHIVGMTGDGVNDAPALKQADVGIAVSGATDAARAASDLVLTAPGLSVIARAVEEARRIFERMTSYSIYRIAETIRVLLFMTLSILVFNFYPVTAVMIVLLAILNDVPIMAIAYDNVAVAPRPVRWDMHRVLTMSVVLGVLGVIASFGLFWLAERFVPRVPHRADVIQTLIFLKLLVAGHFTIYLTRTPGWFWKRPWPNWKLIVAGESTKVVGTLVAVYGWHLMQPIGWAYAGIVWGYAIAWFVISDVIKNWTYRLMRHGPARHRSVMQRMTQHLGAHAS